jgi:hypothetical protein
MEERKLGGVGSYVIFENEHVKVWQNDLEPGEGSDWHLHTMHYLFVGTAHGDLRVHHKDGTSDDIVMEVGKVVMGQKDSVHQLVNVGSNPYSSVIIEIKK